MQDLFDKRGEMESCIAMQSVNHQFETIWQSDDLLKAYVEPGPKKPGFSFHPDTTRPYASGRIGATA